MAQASTNAAYVRTFPSLPNHSKPTVNTPAPTRLLNTNWRRQARQPGSVRVSNGVTNQAARDQVLNYFRSKTKSSSVKVTSPEEIIAQMEKQMQMFTLLLGAIGSISLIVGGVGVMNVMLVSVTERRREIGIRRALGAKRGDIRGQFLIESIILSLIGGFFGIIFGVGASRVISYFAHWHFALSIGAILLGVGVSNAVGIFFGYYPARQASLLDPIVALKSD